MFKHSLQLACLTTLLISSLASAEKNYEIIDLKVRDAVLLETISTENGMAQFTLPEFEAYDEDRHLIYHQLASPTDFVGSMNAAMDIAGNPNIPLGEILSTFSTHEGEAVDDKQFANADFVLVEFWAEWCSPCKTQMKQIQAFIELNPEFKFAWLKVEKDPTKIEQLAVE